MMKKQLTTEATNKKFNDLVAQYGANPAMDFQSRQQMLSGVPDPRIARYNEMAATRNSLPAAWLRYNSQMPDYFSDPIGGPVRRRF
jgi:hypothetical protein